MPAISLSSPTAADLPALAELCAKTFPSHRYFDNEAYFRDRYLQNSHYDRRASLVGRIDDALVTHCGVFDYDMYIGAARVRTAGIGAVLTRYDVRGKGYMQQTFSAMCEGLVAQGYAMSVLFGIEDYYDRYGYTRAWPMTTYEAHIQHMPHDVPRGAVRTCRPKDLTRLDRFYNRHTHGYTGYARRPTYRTWPRDVVGYMVCDAAGHLKAYALFMLSHDTLQCIEAIGNVDELLRLCARVMRQKTFRTLSFVKLHYTSPLAQRLRAGSVKEKIVYHENGEAMAKIVSLAAVLDACLPVLRERLETSAARQWRGSLTLTYHTESVTLVRKRGDLVCEHRARSGPCISGEAPLAQLILGTTSLEELCATGMLTADAEARAIGSILFPRQHPCLAHKDFY